LDEDQEKMIDIWYNDKYGLYFWGCSIVHTTENVGHYQQAYYVGGTDSVKCDEIAPTLYHPNQGEIGYSPPVHKDAYYCVITSDNRVAKIHWLGEEGEGWFEWWFE